MLTPQEVSSHAFTKGFMGGYNMAMVDEFLDELTDDYTALYKENAALKAKMKVLVEKVEDRATEDSMRATLLTAQKMADSIVREAEAKRNTLLAQAESDARERIAQIQLEVEAAEDRLRQGQRELAQFIAATQSVCNKELEFLERLPQLPVEISAAAVPVQEIGTTVAASFEEKPPEEAAAAEPAAGIAVPPAGDLPAPQAPYPEGDPFTQDSKDPQDSMEVTRRIKFDKLDDLKFGPNYTGGT